ncbi:MAG: hypothetical protein H7Y30_09440 [Pyrinomonadaceae bacterium]|nr:hypothetical protein [Pyrinomonadaceae bacterium]
MSRLPPSERLRLAALILSDLTQQGETPVALSRTAIELLEEMPGNRLFKTSEEADEYLSRERDSWDS